jgi:hypothetical protein
MPEDAPVIKTDRSRKLRNRLAIDGDVWHACFDVAIVSSTERLV